MKRREFITLIGGAAAAWPIVARAQQTGRNVLASFSRSPRDAPAMRRITRLRGRPVASIPGGLQVGNERIDVVPACLCGSGAPVCSPSSPR
jgi:putative ABC transport system substrate-binding protein